MSQEQLQQLIDGVFQYLETQESNRPFLVLALKEVNAAVDDLGLPALYAWLAAHNLLPAPVVKS